MIEELPLSNNDNSNILKDELIMLTEEDTKENYPEPIRRVAVYDEKNDKVIELITNNLIWTAFRYLKELANFNWSLSNMIAFLRMDLFVKIVLKEWLDNPFNPRVDLSIKTLQGSLFT